MANDQRAVLLAADTIGVLSWLALIVALTALALVVGDWMSKR